MLAFASCILSSCKKDASRCENWEYQDVCSPKSASANCDEYVHKVANICYKELQDAHEGRTSLIYENDTVRVERHYVRQVQ